jgi:hypothetical protein
LTFSVSEGEVFVSVSAANEEAAASVNADAKIIAMRVRFMDSPQKKFRGTKGRPNSAVSMLGRAAYH